jgi:hypothetical protein
MSKTPDFKKKSTLRVHPFFEIFRFATPPMRNVGNYLSKSSLKNNNSVNKNKLNEFIV